MLRFFNFFKEDYQTLNKIEISRDDLLHNYRYLSSLDKVDQEVIIYSCNPNDKNSLENAAKICNTIPYDLLVSLAETTKRVIV